VPSLTGAAGTAGFTAHAMSQDRQLYLMAGGRIQQFTMRPESPFQWGFETTVRTG